MSDVSEPESEPERPERKTITQREPDRVNKRDFVNRVARRAGVPVRVASSVYDSMIEEILEVVAGGNRVTLTGFGKFYPKAHEGHKIYQFPKKNEAEGEGTAEAVIDSEAEPKAPPKTKVDDYYMLKFSATREVNKKVTTIGPVIVANGPKKNKAKVTSAELADGDLDEELDA